MDVLSDILGSLSIGSSALGTLEVSAPWSLRFADGPPVVCYSVVSGEPCWLRQAGKEPLLLSVGDTVLLASGSQDIIISSDPTLQPVGIGTVFTNHDLANARDIEPDMPLRLKWGGGGKKTILLGAAFGISTDANDVILAAMPEMTIFRAAEGQLSSWIRFCTAFLDAESGNWVQGYVASARRMAEIIIVSAIRAHLLRIQSEGAAGHGWTGGLRDRRIARALAAIHKRPGERWTVARLAEHVGMSRTGFATLFAQLTNRSPIEYLTEWRMHLARTRLAQDPHNIGRLAHDLGYRSEGAFRKVFKDKVGSVPSRYGKRYFS